MDEMTKFNFPRWWRLITAAGAIVSVVFLIAQLIHGFLLGVGLLLFGIGGWINHPVRQQMCRNTNSVGLALNDVGIVFVGLSLLLMVFAP
jgi:hypothetical protein